MRILHVVPTYMPAWRYGGPIRSVHGLCKALVMRGHDVHVYTTNVDGENDLDIETGVPVDRDGVKVWYFPSRWLRKIYWSPQMRRVLSYRLAGFDIVHLHSVYVWTTWATARLAEQAGKPYLVAPRGALVQDLVRRKRRWVKRAWIKLIERHTLERAAAIHVTSEREGQEIAWLRLKEPAIVVVPNAIDDACSFGRTTLWSVAPVAASPQGEYVLYLGRLSWEKGLDRLMAAMAQLPELRLVIAGSGDAGYRRTLDDLAKRLGIKERLVYAGHVEGDSKRRLLEQAALLVLPSYSENFGNAVLEAMQSGCPVVVTPEVGLAPVVQRSGAGFVVQGEPKPLAQAIARIARDKGLRRQMGEAGRRTIAEHFTWPVVAKQMEGVYQSILASARGAS